MARATNEPRPNDPSPTEHWLPGDLIDEYWEDLRAGRAPKPDTWLLSRGGDPKQSSPLHVLSLLYEAASSQAISSPQAFTHLRPPSAGGPGRAEPTGSLTPGELLDGKLRIMDLLGAGGMGEVYVAWHEALEREVAVKVLPRDMAGDEASVARFRKSIAAQAKTGSHANIVAVMDAGWHEGHMYLVMEYVAGMDLEALLRSRSPLPWREVCDWMRQTACGLEHAHRAGLVHRDIKPSNLIRAQDGTVKLLDWGLARTEHAPSASPHTGGTELVVEHIEKYWCPSITSDDLRQLQVAGDKM